MENVPACFMFRDQVSRGTSGYRLSKACEASTGPDGIDGVQWLNGLVRVYLKSKKARDLLLMKGVTLNKIHIPVIGTNPNIVEGDEETVKLIIGQIPLSLANSEIEKALAQLSDVKIKSKMFFEHYRDDDGKLTSYKSGRRFVYIVKPNNPLPKSIQIMKWKASLYHYGQKNARSNKDSNPESPVSTQPINEPLPGIANSRAVSPPGTSMTQESPGATPLPPSIEGERGNNQPVLDSFFRKPTRTVTPTTSTRGRTKARQQRSRSASLSRKRVPSDDERMEGSECKSRREVGPATSVDYFEFDPTRHPPQD